MDSRGLRFMKRDSNPMVNRWFVDTQEFDFTLEDILGKNNPVADGFSRLVANNMPKGIQAALVTPIPIPPEVNVLIGKVHNSISGHHGLERTLRMLTTPSSPDSSVILCSPKTKYLRQRIRRYIHLCPCCQKSK
jgi:hypothetical protein